MGNSKEVAGSSTSLHEDTQIDRKTSVRERSVFAPIEGGAAQHEIRTISATTDSNLREAVRGTKSDHEKGALAKRAYTPTLRDRLNNFIGRSDLLTSIITGVMMGTIITVLGMTPILGGPLAAVIMPLVFTFGAPALLAVFAATSTLSAAVMYIARKRLRD